MELHELSLNQFLEVKLLRLNKPKFNSQIIPLNGSYNSLEDLRSINEDNFESTTSPMFENLFREFNLNESISIPIDNMFSLTSSFGKILFCETLEALLIINNTSDKEVVLRDFKVKVSNEVLEGYESMYRKTEYNLINVQNQINIPGNRFYIHKIKLSADIMCKYSVEIDLQYTSVYFNDEFIKNATNKTIKTISSQYYIENNSNVIRKYYKKFLFATNLPFKIKERFFNDNMTKCFLEINLVNQSPYSLHIEEFLLIPDSDKSSVSSGGSGIVLHNEKELRNFIIESDEEINIVFSFSNYKSAISHANYVFKVCWRNSFDSTNKYINYVLKNRLNTYNDLFSLNIVTKPQAIIINEHFTIVLQISNKTSKNYKLKISKERYSDKDLEIIDILNNEFELTNNENINLICKSEFIGCVQLPRLVITEESSKKQFYFDKLLNFNCANKIELI